MIDAYARAVARGRYRREVSSAKERLARCGEHLVQVSATTNRHWFERNDCQRVSEPLRPLRLQSRRCRTESGCDNSDFWNPARLGANTSKCGGGLQPELNQRFCGSACNTTDDETTTTPAATTTTSNQDAQQPKAAQQSQTH